MAPNADPNKPTETPVDMKGIAALLEDVKVTVEGKQQLINVRLDELEKIGGKDGTIEKWLAEVAEKTNKAGTPQGANRFMESSVIQSSIPDRRRKCIDLWCRAGEKPERAIILTAMESWLKNAVLMHRPDFAARSGVMALEEMERIERSFGFDSTVSKGSPMGQKAALQEDTDAEGGFLVPVPLEAEFIRSVEDEAIIRRLTRVFPMNVKTHNFPDLATNLSVAVVAEEGTIPQSEPTVGQKALTALMFAVRAIASVQLVQDSAIGIFALLFELMGEKYALEETRQALEGTGTGEFTGINAASGTLAVTNGANGDFFTPAKILEQKWKSRRRATRRGSAFVMAPEIVQQIEAFRADAAAAADKAGLFLYVPANGRGDIGGLGNIPEGTIHGIPVIDVAEIKIDRTVGSSTDASNCYSGPFRSATILGDLLGMTFGVSEHTQWATGQLDLRMLKRTAWLVVVPGDLTIQTGLNVV